MSEMRNRFVAPAMLIVMAAGLCGGCATAPPPGPPVLDATDPAAVQSAMPTVIVTGTVDNARDNDGVLMINFKGTEKSHFYAVVLSSNREAVNAGFGGDVAKAIDGKAVRVTGKVVLYRGRPEIVIAKPDQLVIVPQ